MIKLGAQVGRASAWDVWAPDLSFSSHKSEGLYQEI